MAQIEKANSLGEWLDQRLKTRALMKVLLTEYWIPKKINFLWSFGMVLVTLFVVLIVTGIFLLMYYKPDAGLAFFSVNYTIMQEVAYGWVFRHMHAVAASLIFLFIYIHMFTGIYYGSFKSGREVIWITGMLLFVLFSAAGFSGYMLPWGQMSYWAATVITGLFEKIPLIGPDLVFWIRGDYIVGDATLTRFFMLHVFLFPLAIILIVAIHFFALRTPHVNNEDGEEIDFEAEAVKYIVSDKKKSKVMPFWPKFMAEDIFVMSVVFTIFFFLVFFGYSFAMDPINFLPADYTATPSHIYPEWYFLWSYEVLRGIHFSSSLGLIAFTIANAIFFLLPWLDRDKRVRPMHERPLVKIWFWSLVAVMIGLTIFGKLPADGGFAWTVHIGLLLSILFLVLTLVVLPLASYMERKKEEL
ncbi:MAG: cytochrome bc complex cytochrome b subunit [Helicobacteraceae bacterium]|jgi:ubiquinol-cytochrome c reductase cytochrome b subunit|nr:cytochrome bc complex cytochrome b subunit [Helicobacteraceae bacterium]